MVVEYSVALMFRCGRSTDLEQREGRIIRQVNENAEVDVYRYVTKDTFDAYLYQMIENNQRFILQIMTYGRTLQTIFAFA